MFMQQHISNNEHASNRLAFFVRVCWNKHYFYFEAVKSETSVKRKEISSGYHSMFCLFRLDSFLVEIRVELKR